MIIFKQTFSFPSPSWLLKLPITVWTHEPRPPRQKIWGELSKVSKVQNTSRTSEYELTKEDLSPFHCFELDFWLANLKKIVSKWCLGGHGSCSRTVVIWQNNSVIGTPRLLRQWAPSANKKEKGLWEIIRWQSTDQSTVYLRKLSEIECFVFFDN